MGTRCSKPISCLVPTMPKPYNYDSQLIGLIECDGLYIRVTNVYWFAQSRIPTIVDHNNLARNVLLGNWDDSVNREDRRTRPHNNRDGQIDSTESESSINCYDPSGVVRGDFSSNDITRTTPWSYILWTRITVSTLFPPSTHWNID